MDDTTEPARGVRVARRATVARDVLRFATIAVDEVGRGATRPLDDRPVLEWIAWFDWRMKNAGGDQLLPAVGRRASATIARRHQFGDDSAVGGNRHSLTRLDATDVATQVVFDLTDACGNHTTLSHVAT